MLDLGVRLAGSPEQPDQLPVSQCKLLLLLPQPLPELGPPGAHQVVALEVRGVAATGQLEWPPVIVHGLALYCDPLSLPQHL